MSTEEWIQVEILTSSLIEIKFMNVNLNSSKQPLQKRGCSNLHEFESFCEEKLSFSKSLQEELNYEIR
jgi:hypothetical protein